MNRAVGEGPRVKRSPRSRVSVENTGWSEGEVVNPSSIQEVNVAAAMATAAIMARRDFSVFIRYLFVMLLYNAPRRVLLCHGRGEWVLVM